MKEQSNRTETRAFKKGNGFAGLEDGDVSEAIFKCCTMLKRVLLQEKYGQAAYLSNFCLHRSCQLWRLGASCSGWYADMCQSDSGMLCRQDAFLL